MMMVTYDDEKKWYEFNLNDEVYVIRLIPVEQIVHETIPAGRMAENKPNTLKAVFTLSSNPSGEAIATVVINTLDMSTDGLGTLLKEVRSRDLLFINAAKHSVLDFLDRN